jgi:hypothetical protein
LGAFAISGHLEVLPMEEFKQQDKALKCIEQSKALKLLTEYRPVLWRKTVLEAVSGDKNKKNKALYACLEQIALTQELVQALKTNKRLGEKLYWVIYVTFMTDKQPGDVEEMLACVDENYGYISRRTYFRLRKRAIEIINAHLEEMAVQSQAG